MSFNLNLAISFQAPKETVTCILNCMAHMMKISEDVEEAFLKRAIKAFAWVSKYKTCQSGMDLKCLNLQQVDCFTKFRLSL